MSTIARVQPLAKLATPMASKALGVSSARTFTGTTRAQNKVAVVGAAGGIGQPMSLLLKLSGKIEHLSLFDIVNTPGVAADISHCDSKAKVTGHKGAEEMGTALDGCDIVVIPAGVPRKPGMTRDDLFNTNASIVKGIAEQCSKSCPNACFLIISNPVNSTVPIFADVLKANGVYNPQKLMGVTTLDVVRAKTFVAENQGMDVSKVKVDVIGGHAGTTIMPLLSQVKGATFSEEDIAALTHRIQFGGDEVVQAKDGAGSATLSMAHAGAYFAGRVLDGLNGVKNVKECTFVDCDLTDAPFFASPCTLGKDGVSKIHGFSKLTKFEQSLVDDNVPALITMAKKGSDFVKNN
uniref:Malate dehydrogenase n=1 Tax=Undaria pinnatifida TaxID=74381 RepID=A0A097IUL2_UNDPI|nr:malate dehydrogenase [Undaria pinnatifida]|eukprot:jgi/Undpi1/7512/HiC_scaffold_22.g09985.m1